MTEPVRLAITLPDRATALAVASELVGYPVVEFAQTDGRLDGIYWCLHEIGEMRTPVVFDEAGEPVSGGDPVPGWHLIGLWHGPAETVPSALAALHVDRQDWWPRFG